MCPSQENDLESTVSKPPSLNPTSPHPLPDIEELHRIACRNNQSSYSDPSSGLLVFTSLHLSQRKCCGCGCRHCPYRPSTCPVPTASMLHGSLDDLPDAVDVLFWSGGKDSFCALRSLQSRRVRDVVLLTTYNAHSGTVAHQEVAIRDVERQAKYIDIPLLGVPVAYGEYLQCVKKGLNRLKDHGVELCRLVFGDLHLRHIRGWRDRNFGTLGMELYYPLWDVDYGLLLHELEDADVVVRISAVDKDANGTKGIKVGDLFHREFVKQLPQEVDAFGENGEFHTLVHVWERPGTQQRRAWELLR